MEANQWYENLGDVVQDVFVYERRPFLEGPWDAATWLHWFNVHRNSPGKESVWRMNVTAMLWTLRACNERCYVAASGALVPLPRALLEQCVTQTRMFENAPPLPPLFEAAMRGPQSVEIFNNDCCDVAASLLANGSRPLVLNLAAHASPGGGFLYGHWAQEEGLMRRSNYWMAIDPRVGTPRVRYPLPRLGGCYTPGVAVFRAPEAEGYAFLEAPILMDFFAVAAWRNPPLDGPGRLARNIANDMLTKIRLALAVAAATGHDSVVLGALGCGAFANPPRHVAQLFRQAVTELGCYFRIVTFAIFDDQNARQGSNLAAFCDAFRTALDGDPPDYYSGAMQQQQPGSPPHASRPCPDYYDLQPDAEYSDCPTYSFVEPQDGAKSPGHMPTAPPQPQPCKHGGLCRDIGNASHAAEYTHPSRCEYGGLCTHPSHSHMVDYAHNLDTCKYGAACTDDSEEHCIKFEHPRTRCEHEYTCAEIGNARHMKLFDHGFLPPCRSGSECDAGAHHKEHAKRYSHPCWFGAQCRHIKSKDMQHLLMHTHQYRPPCKFEGKCEYLLNGDRGHCLKFSHPNVRDIREECQYGKFCLDRSPGHHIQFSHPARPVQFCMLRGLNNDFLLPVLAGAGGSGGFHANKDQLLAKLNAPAAATGGRFNVMPELKSWVQCFHPLHRCKIDTLKMIIEHGAIVSLHFQEFMEEHPDKAAMTEVVGDATIARILHRAQKTMTDLKGLRDWAKLVIRSKVAGQLPQDEKATHDLKKGISAVIGKQLMKELECRIEAIATRAKTHVKTGIKYHVDKTLGFATTTAYL
eukprot:m51a1_g6210 hypothetical protein (804) ;mRNA; f:153976-157455